MGPGRDTGGLEAISYYLSGQIIHSHLPSALPKQVSFLLLFWKEITFRQWHQYPANLIKSRMKIKWFLYSSWPRKPTPPRNMALSSSPALYFWLLLSLFALGARVEICARCPQAGPVWLLLQSHGWLPRWTTTTVNDIKPIRSRAHLPNAARLTCSLTHFWKGPLGLGWGMGKLLNWKTNV